MRANLNILAYLGLIGAASASPAPAATKYSIDFSYYSAHNCKSSYNPAVVELTKEDECYNLEFPARAFKHTDFPKRCKVAAYKKADCKGGIDFEFLGHYDKCIPSDGKATGDFINSLQLLCRG